MCPPKLRYFFFKKSDFSAIKPFDGTSFSPQLQCKLQGITVYSKQREAGIHEIKHRKRLYKTKANRLICEQNPSNPTHLYHHEHQKD